MLLFPTKPDPVFLAILHDALELRRGELRTFIESGAALEEWEIGNPTLATSFMPSSALDVIDRLLAASRDTIIYRPNDYHWLVIYDCLDAFCALHNDLLAEEPTRMTTVGEFEVGGVSFLERVICWQVARFLPTMR